MVTDIIVPTGATELLVAMYTANANPDLTVTLEGDNIISYNTMRLTVFDTGRYNDIVLGIAKLNGNSGNIHLSSVTSGTGYSFMPFMGYK